MSLEHDYSSVRKFYRELKRPVADCDDEVHVRNQSTETTEQVHIGIQHEISSSVTVDHGSISPEDQQSK